MPRNTPPAPVRRIQRPLAPVDTFGPLLPGEYRPLAPVPAASDPSFWASVTEAELLKALVTYHQWTRLDPNTLRRYRRHGAQLAVIDGGNHAA